MNFPHFFSTTLARQKVREIQIFAHNRRNSFEELSLVKCLWTTAIYIRLVHISKFLNAYMLSRLVRFHFLLNDSSCALKKTRDCFIWKKSVNCSQIGFKSFKWSRLSRGISNDIKLKWFFLLQLLLLSGMDPSLDCRPKVVEISSDKKLRLGMQNCSILLTVTMLVLLTQPLPFRHQQKGD